MKVLRHRLSLRAAPLALLPLAFLACTSGEDGSGSSGASSGAVVQFVVTTQEVSEGVVQTGAQILLSEPQPEAVEVFFQVQAPPVGAAATAFVDYLVLTSSPAVIPANTMTSGILLQIFDDGLGELDEGLSIHLTAASNAGVGAASVFTLTINDNDALLFPEVEPNNNPLTQEWNVVGSISEGLAYEITGAIVSAPDEVDLFHFTATADTDVFLELDPVVVGADVILAVIDTSDTLLAGGPGQGLTLTYPALDGEVFLAEVSNTVAGTNYTLTVVGLAPVSPLMVGEPGVVWRRVLVVDETGEAVQVEERIEYER